MVSICPYISNVKIVSSYFLFISSTAFTASSIPFSFITLENVHNLKGFDVAYTNSFSFNIFSSLQFGKI